MKRMEYLALTMLNGSRAHDRYSAMSLTDMLSEQKFCSRGTLRTALNKLMEMELVGQGLVDGNAFSYYITSKGMDFLKLKDKEA